jgi:hypothetical protein
VRRAVAVAVASMLVGLLGGSATAAIAADSTGRLKLEARIDGRVVGDGRLVIDPARTAVVEITVSNETGSAQRVRTVRLSGTALALTFFAYDTTVPFEVPAGETVSRSFPLDLADLGRQATGLLPSSVQVLGQDRAVLAEVDTTADVRGSVWSVYGMFGIALVVLTLLAWLGALVALARHRLPANRWRRALRFLPAGFGTGLSAVITLSVLRLVAPAPAAELPLILGAAAAALVLGYLTPYPGDAATQPAGDYYPGDGLARDGFPGDDSLGDEFPGDGDATDDLDGGGYASALASGAPAGDGQGSGRDAGDVFALAGVAVGGADFSGDDGETVDADQTVRTPLVDELLPHPPPDGSR